MADYLARIRLISVELGVYQTEVIEPPFFVACALPRPVLAIKTIVKICIHRKLTKPETAFTVLLNYFSEVVAGHAVYSTCFASWYTIFTATGCPNIFGNIHPQQTVKLVTNQLLHQILSVSCAVGKDSEYTGVVERDKCGNGVTFRW